jgi:hypothetical protein
MEDLMKIEQGNFKALISDQTKRKAVRDLKREFVNFPLEKIFTKLKLNYDYFDFDKKLELFEMVRESIKFRF